MINLVSSIIVDVIGKEKLRSNNYEWFTNAILKLGLRYLAINHSICYSYNSVVIRNQLRKQS